jgi:hypothetical protein
MKKWMISIGTILSCLLFAQVSFADVIATRTSTTAVQVGVGAASCVPVVNLHTLRFVTTRDYQRVVFGYTGECSVKSPDNFSWLNIDLVVDGVQVSPTQTTDNAFCTSRGVNDINGWVSASATGVVVVPEPGLHTAQVNANLVNCNDATDDVWRLDDSTVVLWSN